MSEKIDTSKNTDLDKNTAIEDEALAESLNAEIKISVIVPIYNMEKFLEKKAMMTAAADFMNAKYGSGTVELEVPADYNYYYIKITQPDGDIAVTAPVWVGKVEAVVRRY